MNKEFSVDAACSKNPGPVEYQMVDHLTKETIFHCQLPDGTNNVGEFLGLIEGVKYIQDNSISNAILYTDSITALSWLKKKFANTKYKTNGEDNSIIQLILDAEYWLNTNEVYVDIRKWDTRSLGEIPADFGRK